jgi:predicted MFS family arabinose efflux permease
MLREERAMRPAVLVAARNILPLACGYYLSFLFRMINAVLAHDVAQTMGLGAASLGIMTSAYFLAYAGAALPLGVMLDRYGPRRVQGCLMLVAALGATLFAVADSVVILYVGRALIGLGVAGGLMAGLKAIVMWVPRRRVPAATGCFYLVGALGATSATTPAEMLRRAVGWRVEYASLAVASAAVGIAILMVLREPDRAEPRLEVANFSLLSVYADPRFRRLAPLSAICVGTAWALHGLWAAAWMTDVETADRPTVMFQLFLMGLTLCAGALLLGMAADWARRAGISLRVLLGATGLVLLAAELVLIIRPPLPVSLPWCVIGMVGAVPVISYTVLADQFPQEMAGRANAALNLLHITAAFAIQSLVGLILQHWPSDRASHYPPLGYEAAFGMLALILLGALVWFVLPVRRLAPSLTVNDTLN